MKSPSTILQCCFLIVSIGAVVAGWPSDAFCQAPTAPFPFKLQKNGSISMRDAVKLTRRPAGSDRITNDALQKIKDANPTRYNQSFKKTTKKIMPPRGDLYAKSMVLGGEGGHTVVPKNSILFVPANLKIHLLEVPEGPLILWPHFFKQNSNWIQTQEVTFAEARGDDKILESSLNRIARSRRIVVAVHKGYPISVIRETAEGQKNSNPAPLKK